MDRFLVTWYDGNRQRVSIVDNGGGVYPFGVDPSMIHDDCEHINVIISIPNDFDPLVVIDDEEVTLESVEP